ncbi:hypothetical protein ABQE69_09125 [Mycolicibacillus trivialis]
MTDRPKNIIRYIPYKAPQPEFESTLTAFRDFQDESRGIGAELWETDLGRRMIALTKPGTDGSRQAIKVAAPVDVSPLDEITVERTSGLGWSVNINGYPILAAHDDEIWPVPTFTRAQKFRIWRRRKATQLRQRFADPIAHKLGYIHQDEAGY